MTGAVQALLCTTALASGGGSGSVSLTPRTVSNTGTGTGTITCGYKFRSNGNVYKTTTVDALLEAWLDSGSAGDFEVRATLTFGDTPTGTLGAWLALSSDRLWSLSAGAGVTKSCTLSVQIRDVATQTVQDSATIVIKADNGGSSGGGGGGGGGTTGSGGTVSIDNQSVSGESTGHVATAQYVLDTDGNVYNEDGLLLEAWLDSGVAGDFEARMTVTSGSLSGTTGSWLALSSTRTWSLSSSTSTAASGTVEIRDASSLTVLDSATINFMVTVR